MSGCSEDGSGKYFGERYKGLQVDAAVSGREGFIELTKDGFRMTSPVTLEEGLHEEGDDDDVYWH